MTTATLDKSIRDAIADMQAAEDKTVIVTEGGKPVAFMMPIEILDAIEDLLDGQDAKEAIEAAEASDEPNVAWKDLKASLGL